MKNLLFLGTLFLCIQGSSFLNAQDKQIVPSKQDDKSKTSTGITAIVGPILTNILTLLKYTFKIASNFKEIEESALRLEPGVKCIIKPGADECDEIGCSTTSRCTGTVLSDVLKVTYPVLEGILGSVSDDGKTVNAGVMFSIVDTLEKLIGVIPDSLYTNKTLQPLNLPKFKPKIVAVREKLQSFAKGLPDLTRKFSDAIGMLNGVVLTLNPEMLVVDLPVKPLPPVEPIKEDEKPSAEVAKEMNAALAIAAA